MNKRLFLSASLAVFVSLSVCGEIALGAEVLAAGTSLHAGVKNDETTQPSVRVLVPEALPNKPKPTLQSQTSVFPIGTAVKVALPRPVVSIPNYSPPSPPKRFYLITDHDGSPFRGFSPSYYIPNNAPRCPSWRLPNSWWTSTKSEPPLTPTNGVKAWGARYQTTVMAIQPSRTNTSVRWSSANTSINLTPPPVKPMLAAAQASPAVQANVAPSWADWYKRVGDEVYERWRSADVKAGMATVVVTAYPSRDIDCRVTDFHAAEGTTDENDVRSRFCQSALDTINNLNRYQFWQFPPSKDYIKQVQFELELQRRVGETPGCRVLKVHRGDA